MTYKIEPDVLHKVAKQAAGVPMEGGALITPFAMVGTLLVSLEFESVRRSAIEFTRLVRRRTRR